MRQETRDRCVVLHRSSFARYEVLADPDDQGECKWCGDVGVFMYYDPDSIGDRSTDMGYYCDRGCAEAYNDAPWDK